MIEQRIKTIKAHIADLEELQNHGMGKLTGRYAEEILNAKFELRLMVLQFAASVLVPCIVLELPV
jgi:hypothetical protein